jgi:hypothetical protein
LSRYSRAIDWFADVLDEKGFQTSRLLRVRKSAPLASYGEQSDSRRTDTNRQGEFGNWRSDLAESQVCGFDVEKFVQAERLIRHPWLAVPTSFGLNFG